MSILTLELYKIFNRRRSYIGFAAVLAMVLLVLLAFNYEGKEMFAFITKNLGDTFILQGNVMNGYTFAYLVLKSLWVHFPILVALVTGDLVSGEEQSGTLRMVLSRPVNRNTLLTAKFMSAFVYVALLVTLMAVASVGLGYLFFGKGDLLVLIDNVNIIPSDDVMWRFIAAYSYGILSMSTVAALSVFLSASTANSIAAILCTIAIVIVLTLLTLFNIPAINVLKPFLFTNYTSSWQDLFVYQSVYTSVIWDAVILIIYILIFYFVTMVYFQRKDILS
jgi:ABC-2 type transport system permease protein